MCTSAPNSALLIAMSIVDLKPEYVYILFFSRYIFTSLSMFCISIFCLLGDIKYIKNLEVFLLRKKRMFSGY